MSMFNFTKVIYLDLLDFLKNPGDQRDPIQTWTEKAKKLFSLLILDIPIMILLMVVLSGLKAVGLFNADSNKLSLLLKTMPVWTLIFVMVILIPFIEELIFRLYLRYKNNYFARFFIFLTLFTGVKNHDKIETWVTDFWTKRYLIIFYFSALLFGYVHLTNYDYSILIILLSPLVIAPQFVVGIFCGYLRVRHDLVTGYFMHAIHNAIFLCIPLLLIAGSSKYLSVETPDYSLKIRESSKQPKESTSTFYADGVTFKNTRLKSIMIEILGKKEMLLKTNNDSLLNKLINLEFRNKLKNNPQNRRYSLNQNEREDVLNQLSKLYDFKVKNEFKPQEIWELHVEDSTVLIKSRADTTLTYNLNVSDEKVTITNSSLWGLTKGLTQACKRFIFDQTFTKKRYTITLQVKDFEILQNELNTKYGLSLKKAEKKLEFTTIEFSKREKIPHEPKTIYP